MFPSSSPDPGEKKQPARGMAATTRRFLAVMQGTADLFWILTPTGEMQETTPSWQSFTGQRESECQGRGWFDALYPDNLPQIEETLHRSVLSARPAESECHIRRSDGVYRLIRLHAFPVCLLDKIVSEFVICGTDITCEQMSDTQIQLAVEASGMGMWTYDLVTQHFVATEQWKRLFGLPNDTPITFESFLAHVHHDDRACIEDLAAHARTENKTYNVQFRLIGLDGKLHWVTSRLKYISDKTNQSSHLVGSAIDITEQKQAEERVVAILESITEAFFQIDREWRITYTNRRGNELTGTDREALLGQRIWDIRPDLCDTSFEQKIRKAMEMQQKIDFEFFLCRTQKWTEVHVYPMQCGLSLYVQDITKRKHTEEALRESEVRFRHFVESNLIGIITHDLEGTIIESNDKFLSLVDATREDLAASALRLNKLTPSELLARDDQARAEVLTTGVYTPFEKEYILKNGKRIPVLVGGTLFRRDAAGPLILAFVLDLTAQKEYDRQKDLFLSMTSHEMKTPLTTLRGRLQLVQKRLERTITTTNNLSPEWSTFAQSLSKNLENSVHQIDIQTRLINDLLDISRITANTLDLALHPCDLVSVVYATVEDLRVTAPEHRLLLVLPEQIINVLADRDRISQVVTNYVTNALRYSSSDLPITIGLNIQNAYARVWVRDRGPGLTAEVQKEIWERYNQARDVPMQQGAKKGLGLGLYISRTLIEQHHGACGVESTPGKGSTFWFTLPILT
jgi:PAS domain S-box-containing protein